ncbi:hypothetical protein CBR_g28077 [Chara braunii]|uniref:Uncharacterized protein n=1 Tax=Chara braunii TaxID=69332 RepID=A0A388L9E2_CHABU|nr:hypothetical protein CBR_g28077 [Chara braunii]|eukprot:GBG78852.1 hypothetical protein CBR_g28077 [Chara braunii]
MDKLHKVFVAVAESITPARSVSAFKEKGVLTPEEFVQAGDNLVAKCPTWSWEGGDTSRRKTYLPPGKQFLVTRNGKGEERWRRRWWWRRRRRRGGEERWTRDGEDDGGGGGGEGEEGRRDGPGMKKRCDEDGKQERRRRDEKTMVVEEEEENARRGEVNRPV